MKIVIEVAGHPTVRDEFVCDDFRVGDHGQLFVHLGSYRIAGYSRNGWIKYQIFDYKPVDEE